MTDISDKTFMPDFKVESSDYVAISDDQSYKIDVIWGTTLVPDYKVQINWENTECKK